MTSGAHLKNLETSIIQQRQIMTELLENMIDVKDRVYRIEKRLESLEQSLKSTRR